MISLKMVVFGTLLIVVFLAILLAESSAVVTTYSQQNWAPDYTVPAGVTKIRITCRGAGGGKGGWLYLDPGKGMIVAATFTVTPNSVFKVYVGELGSTSADNAGGWNGGGTGSGAYCGGGGGASDIRYGGTALNDRVLVAGGGGGACYSCDSAEGGDAGGGSINADAGKYN